ncbi:MAG: aminotransferase class I/II-fold pyridoxal phosphate-dependent enzyme [Gemmatimonadaceae bacterium]
MTRTAQRTATFNESVIREMTRVAQRTGAVNLAQGFPDFPMPAPMKAAACAAIMGDLNQYAITWGSPALRVAIAEKYRRWYGLTVDPDTEITVTCGATEAMAATFMALINPGDEVIILDPFYENYGPDAVLAGARPVFVPLIAPQWDLDIERLAASITPRTRALVLNTPHNPTGKVFSRAEVSAIAELAQRHDFLVFTDEIYEHLVYAGHHHSIATWPGMRERTVTISGLSKTFSCTGWRLGYAIAAPGLSNAIRKVHDFLTVGAPAPLQAAAAIGMAFDADYYNNLQRAYKQRRDVMMNALVPAGFACTAPDGAYYILADFSAIDSGRDDREFAIWLAESIGIATVPGSSFYGEAGGGTSAIRFAFCKTFETLGRAAERLETLHR